MSISIPWIRTGSRAYDALRPLRIEPNYYSYAEGSCLVAYGNTEVIVAATVDDQAPPHLRGKGKAWVTAEYSMLPKSSRERIRRERDRVGGRTHEIQRLIGRALRSVTSMEGWGERTITIDCDVLRADGGTRTASITGAFVALALALKHLRKTNAKISPNLEFPLRHLVSAVSVGIVQGSPMLDLDYSEDSTAETDMNLVMSSDGRIIEIQGTAEREPFSEAEFQALLSLGKKGCKELCAAQEAAIGALKW